MISTAEMQELMSIQFIWQGSGLEVFNVGRSKYIFDGLHSDLVSFLSKNSLHVPTDLDPKNSPKKTIKEKFLKALCFCHLIRKKGQLGIRRNIPKKEQE